MEVDGGCQVCGRTVLQGTLFPEDSRCTTQGRVEGLWLSSGVASQRFLGLWVWLYRPAQTDAKGSIGSVLWNSEEPGYSLTLEPLGADLFQAKVLWVQGLGRKRKQNMWRGSLYRPRQRGDERNPRNPTSGWNGRQQQL